MAPGVRTRLAELAGLPDSQVDLAAGALLIAGEEYPHLALAPYLRRLDVLAERVRDRLAGETAPLIVLQELCRVLFQEEGFRGNADAYYDPRNSFLNDVLDRRLGIPITLGIVMLEVGWRVDLPLSGINFPGHFLVRYDGQLVRLLVDPFDGGRVRWEDQGQELLDRVYGGMVRMRAEFLRPATRTDILARVLTNLKSIYLNTRDDDRALAAVDRILLLRPAAATERRDRGLLLARSGRSDEAVVELERYLDGAPAAADAPRVRSLIQDLSGIQDLSDEEDRGR
ncbi:MAG TPA: transglutaminase-like domain-containing protein [Longimicrobiales bacterium]|nr:transglutaminase-like domain-containing protein [Longimicrobiales bacterium]